MKCCCFPLPDHYIWLRGKSMGKCFGNQTRRSLIYCKTFFLSKEFILLRLPPSFSVLYFAKKASLCAHSFNFSAHGAAFCMLHGQIFNKDKVLLGAPTYTTHIHTYSTTIRDWSSVVPSHQHLTDISPKSLVPQGSDIRTAKKIYIKTNFSQTKNTYKS